MDSCLMRELNVQFRFVLVGLRFAVEEEVVVVVNRHQPSPHLLNHLNYGRTLCEAIH